MHDCLKNIRWSRVLLGALIYLVIAGILQQVSLMLTANYFLMPEYANVWNKIMMPQVGLPPLELTLTSLAYAFVSGFLIATFFAFIKDRFENSCCERASGFTIIIFVFSLIFTYLPMLMLFNLPFLLVASWFIVSTLQVFLASLFFSKLIK
jgi:hypothetical protein